MAAGLFGEPKRDRVLGEALGWREPVESRLADDELRTRIVHAARPELARLARGRFWWEWTAAWGRVAVPVGLAASLAAGALLARVSATTTSAATESSVMLSAAAGSSGAADLGDQLVDQATDSWLLSRALGQ
jgi:hypothetical protein